MRYLAGYKFKETHDEIHYIKRDHGRAGKPYQVNFSTDIGDAKPYPTLIEAEKGIAELMFKFERDPEYRWTPVLINLETLEISMRILSRWH